VLKKSDLHAVTQMLPATDVSHFRAEIQRSLVELKPIFRRKRIDLAKTRRTALGNP